MRPGSTAVQEIAFTLANAIAYVQAAIDAGMDVDDFGPRLSFFWNGHNNFFEEVAKFRASRRMWHRIMTERFGAKDPRSAMLRFHTQTGGSTLTAQQPLNNVVRVSLQALASVLGGTQSLHTNGYDEALSLPTEEAARLALRTQQIIAAESGVVDTPDPLAGSYFVESLTDDVERLAWEYIDRIDEMGGAVAAIEAHFQMDEIEQAAYEYAKSIDDGERMIVGLNKYVLDDEPEPKVLSGDPALEQGQRERLAAFKADRDMSQHRGRARRRRRRGPRFAEPDVSDERGAARPTPRSARSATPSEECSASTPHELAGTVWCGRELLPDDHRPPYRQRPRDRDLVRDARRHAVPDLRQRPHRRLVSQPDRRAGGDRAHRRRDPQRHRARRHRPRRASSASAT